MCQGGFNKGRKSRRRVDSMQAGIVGPFSLFRMRSTMTTNHQLTLGFILLKEGKISKDQLKRALLKQGEFRRFGRYTRLGDVFSKLGILSEEEVASAVEMQETLVVPKAGYTALGLMLIEAGLLNPSQVYEALVEQQFTEKRLGEILVERGVVSAEQLQPLLAKQEEDRGKAQAALEAEMRESGLIAEDENFVIFDMGGGEMSEDEIAKLEEARAAAAAAAPAEGEEPSGADTTYFGY